MRDELVGDSESVPSCIDQIGEWMLFERETREVTYIDKR